MKERDEYPVAYAAVLKQAEEATAALGVLINELTNSDTAFLPNGVALTLDQARRLGDAVFKAQSAVGQLRQMEREVDSSTEAPARETGD